MGVDDEDVPHGIVVAGVHAYDAPAAAMLIAVRVGGDALDVPALAQCDDHLRVRLKRSPVEVVRLVADSGASVLSELLLESLSLLFDLGEHLGRAGEELLEPLDLLLEALVLVF